MTSLAEFAAVRTPLQVPKDWEPPHIEKVGDRGRAVLYLKQTARERDLLVHGGWDPDEYRIKGDVKYRTWMRYDQEWLHYYAFETERIADSDLALDLEEIKRKIGTPRKRSIPATGMDGAYNYVASDWQIGKGEGGGTPATIERVLDSFEAAKQDLLALRKRGWRLPTMSLFGTGDIYEGCTGFYPMQEYQVDLDRRGQTKVVRRLFTEAVKTFAPLVDELRITGVGGKHGEHRKNGKAFTTFADNDDVAVLEALQEIFDGRPGYDHGRFLIPDDELQIVVDSGGVNVGLAHGHQFGKGGQNPQKKAENWWAFQAFNYQPLTKAQILVSGHYHHYTNSSMGLRTHIQAPSLDGGSKWFRDQTGSDSPPGSLVFVTTPNHVLGYDHLRIL